MSRWDQDLPTDRQVATQGARLARWTIIAGGIAILAGLVFATMAIFGVGLFQRGTANFRGATGQIERTRANPAFRIAAYDHFYNLCVAVQAAEGTLQALDEELTTHPSQDRVEQIQASKTALRAGRLESIRQYNADARKTATQGQFRASDLPFQLDPTAEETTCAP